MKYIRMVLALATLIFGGDDALSAGKHLFILSGQSNMAGLNPDLFFTPAVEKEFGGKNVLVVKSAQGGQPIRRWYKQWTPAEGDSPTATGDLYDVLMQKVRDAVAAETVETVTFVWMQGERDAKEKHGEVYQRSLDGLVKQLQKDLQRTDIHVVVGRLSDFDLKNTKYPHWTKVRHAQVAYAEANANAVWVDTDDLNDGRNQRGKPISNDLHYSVEGYRTLGSRFAEQSIQLIRGGKFAPSAKQ
jgi:hypothetical protein